MNRRLMAVMTALTLIAVGCGRGAEDGEDAAEPGPGAELVAGPGFDRASGTIRLGNLTALSGPLTVVSDPINNGMQAYISGVNAAGGLAGRYKIELVVEDTRYDPATTVQQYQKVKDQVAMFMYILGTPPVNAVLPQLKADNVVALPGSLDDRWIREINLIPYGAPYQIQFINGASYYLNDLGGRDKAICAMAIDGPYGDAGLRGLEAAAAAENFRIRAAPRFRNDESDFTAQVTQLRDAGCQAVFLTSLPAHTGAALGAGAKLGFRPQWIGQSPAWDPALTTFEELRSVVDRDFLVMGEGTEWGDETVPGMKRMMDDVRRFAPNQKPDPYFINGYEAAWSVLAVLTKAVELGDITRAGILEAQRQMGVVNLGGLTGDYRYGPPEQRNPPRTSTVFRVNRSKAGLLEAAKKNFTSPAAERFRF